MSSAKQESVPGDCFYDAVAVYFRNHQNVHQLIDIPSGKIKEHLGINDDPIRFFFSAQHAASSVDFVNHSAV